MDKEFEKHLVRFRNRPLLVRIVYSRPRTFIAIAIGIAVFLLLPDTRRLVTRLVVGWDAFAALYLVLAYSMMLRCGIAYIRRSAALQDDGRFVVLLLTALGAFASLAAILFELGASKGNPAGLIIQGVNRQADLQWAVGRSVGDIAAEQGKHPIEAMIDLFSLAPFVDDLTERYSHGMRQRTVFAGALLHEPKVLIVDEPTVGLDPEERVRFRNLLSEIAQGRIVILSTHIVSDVEAVASQIALIRRGRLSSLSTPEALLKRTSGRVFTAVVPSERLAEAQRRVHVSNLIRRADGVHVRYVANGDGAGSVALPGATSVEPTLEDAYLGSGLESSELA